MNSYLQSIIPRLKRHSRDLDKIENFIDKEWVYIDECFNHHEYVFMRDNRLIMSVNGIVKTGSWELLPTGKLLIDRITDRVMLENMFIDSSLMLLRKSGSIEQPFILIDPQKVQEFNVQTYLEDKVAEIINIESISSGTLFLSNKGIVHGATYFSIGEKVESFDGLIMSGTFEVEKKDSGIYCIIESSVVTDYFYKKEYFLTDKKKVFLQQRFPGFISKEDKIQNFNELNLTSEEYFKITDINNYHTTKLKTDENGIVTNIDNFQEIKQIVLAIVIIVSVLSSIFLITYYNVR